MKKAKGQPGCADPQMGHNVTIVYANGEVPTTISRPFFKAKRSKLLFHLTLFTWFSVLSSPSSGISSSASSSCTFIWLFLTLAGSTYKYTPYATPPISWVIVTIA
jgi:hypothetical protein